MENYIFVLILQYMFFHIDFVVIVLFDCHKKT